MGQENVVIMLSTKKTPKRTRESLLVMVAEKESA
jgi:hypothetical protein